MRRLLAAVLLAGAAFGAGAPASAAPVCADPVVPGVVSVHACAGNYCSDKCWLGAELSCETYMFLMQPCALLPGTGG